MLYFSELENKKVVNQKGKYFGNLVDLIFLHQDPPNVTKFIIKTPHKTLQSFPPNAIKNINSAITISQIPNDIISVDNEVSLVKSLLDKQIIDLIGNKVVRVNDVIIQDRPVLMISGIDIGLRGILRRLGLSKIISMFMYESRLKIPETFLSWADIQSLEFGQGTIKLRHREEKLARIPAEDLADYLERTTFKNTKRFLTTVSDEQAAEIFSQLNINFQTHVFSSLDKEKIATFIKLMDPDEAADILLTVSNKKRDSVMNELSEEKQHELRHLMNLSSTPVGDLLTTEFITVPSTSTIRDVVNIIKKETNDFSFLTNVYVINNQMHLVGVFSLHEILLQNIDAPVYKFMVQNPIVIYLTTPVDLVIKKLLKYRISCLPVVDKHRHMLGIVSIDDVSENILSKYI